MKNVEPILIKNVQKDLSNNSSQIQISTESHKFS
jgi:hypothetical protein